VPRRRLGRFLLEVAFLAAVAAAITAAKFHAAAVIAMMAAAWAIVALLEWVVWRDVPHYGRGLPPRFYVPQVALPPPRAVEQRAFGYPAPSAADEEAATWIASEGAWGATHVDWPVLGSPVGEQTEMIEEDEVTEEPAPTVVARPSGDAHVSWGSHDAVEDLDGVEAAESEGAEHGSPAPPGRSPAQAQESLRLPAPARIERSAFHHVDPADAPVRRRWFRRVEEGPVVEVPDGPPPGRRLPGTARTRSGSTAPRT
jgi:hypothetical protein